MGNAGIWFVLIAGVGIASFPITGRLFSNWPDRGYGLARILGLILVGWLWWSLASVGILPQEGWMALILIAGIGAAAWVGKGGRDALAAIREAPGQVILSEAVFLGTFLLFFLAFAMRPYAHLGERPMDLAFLSACWRADSFPPADPWFAGETINYYYFGHALMAMVSRTLGIVPTTAYPLAVATLPALFAGGLLSLFLRLLDRWGRAIAAVGVLFIMGNLYALRESSLLFGAFDMSAFLRSVQVIPGGLNEYPLFSFLVAELHAHVMALPMEVLLLCILLQGIRGPLAAATGALVLGALAVTNTWSAVVCAPLILAALLRHASGVGTLRALLVALATWMGILAAAGVLFLPFHLRHDPLDSVGLEWLGETTTRLGDLAYLYGLPLFVLIPSLLARARLSLGPRLRMRRRTVVLGVAVVVLLVGVASGSGLAALLLVPLFCLATPLALEAAADEREGFVWGLSWMGIAIILGCEVFNVRDGILFEPDHRYNTIMRFHFEATFLLGVAATDRLVRGVSNLTRGGPRRGRRSEVVWAAASILLLVIAGIPPARALSAYLTSGTGGRNADLLAGPGAPGPEEAAAIRWLTRQIRGQPIVVESTGRSYDFRACRISSHTGLPTLLGWIEKVPWWNRKAGDVVRRGAAIEMIYGSPTVEEALPVLRRWGVRYIFVGPWERSTFPEAGLEKLESFPVAFRDGETRIYEVPPP